jgi:protein transport protein SEC24
MKKEGQRRYRRPVPLGRVFVLDVSTPAVQRGIVREVCEAIRRGIYGEKKEKEGEGEDEDDDDDEPLIGKGERVAFITVGQYVGFWNLAAALASPQLLVVSDLDDMYTPLHGGFLVDPVASRSQVEQLLTLVPNMYEAQPDGPSCAIGAAIKGALCGLRSFGGQINFFLSGLPVIGPGKLKPREEQSLAGTDKEKTLFAPNDAFWRNTADELAECGVGVNTFVFPDQACDLATVGILSATTGGEMFFHPKFQPVRDRDALSDEIKRVIVRETAYNATVRIRCSNGLRVSEHTGAFYQRSLTDLEIGTLDESKAFTATIKHEGHKLDERQMAYVQVATLYTSASGERRVRVLNASYSISGLIGNVFRYADFDASVVMLYKEGE